MTLATIDGEKVTGRVRDLSKEDRKYLTALDKDPIRTWTSTFGSKIEARFIRKKGDSVILEKANGSSLTVPLRKLSKADQAYVDKN